MKKIVVLILSFIFLGILCLNISGQAVAQGINDEVIDEISNKVIRFHVLANSNTDVDQELKIKVKDSVINFIFPKLQNVQTIEDARKILIENNDEIISVAEKCIKENGYDYAITTTIGKENFPVKVYGNITLPQGEYEALRILIGNAKGENWWCVMFPPLCFVDVTKGQISYNETEEKMKEVLTNEEFKVVNNNEQINKKNTDNKVTFKLKVFDLLKKKN